jgi:predicted ATPase/DNA-binding XRE family transcriptional regulator
MLTTASATFGDLLRHHRQAAGLTQQELAERAGLSVHGIQKLERGATHPYRDTAQRLIQALRLAPDDQARLRAAVLPVRRHGAPEPSVVDDAVRHNLPVSLTSFVGRDSELEEVTALLASTRLLTLTGVGGCGKTRMALQVARQACDSYTHGTWVAELGPLTDPAQVAPRVAAVLGIRETAEEPIASSLIRGLRARHILLVLDNCEHLLDACAELLDAVLRNCPDISVLATSREPVGVGGEVVWRVPSLAVPEARLAMSLDHLERNACVRLFSDRARAVQPRFALTPRNAPAVAQICQRLDGIPLAVELAAARIGTLTPEQLAERLDQRFRLLTGGTRTALPRQQTLVATLDWSYDLLSRAERRLFERLAVFSGGWTLEAAETVCAGHGVASQDVLDLLDRLARKSLVVAEEAITGAERYAFLETVREYARAKLVARGAADVATLRRQHAEFYVAFAEPLHMFGARARPIVEAPSETIGAGLRHADMEYDNLRASLGYWVEASNPNAGLLLAEHLNGFWMWRGLYGEGRYWLEMFLELDSAAGGKGAEVVPPRMRANALGGSGLFASRQGDYQLSRERYEASAAIWRQLDDKPMLAVCLSWLGLTAWLSGDAAHATGLLEESRRVADAYGEHEFRLGLNAMTLRNMGMVARSQHEYTRATEFFRESVAHARDRAVRDAYSISRGLCHLGRALFLQGDSAHARQVFHEGLEAIREERLAGHTLADCLDWLAGLVARDGKPEAAARLFGAADAQWQASGAVRYAPERALYESELAHVKTQLDEAAFMAGWNEGQALNAAQATAVALHEINRGDA